MSLYAVMFADEAKIGNEYTYRKRRWKFVLSIVSKVLPFACCLCTSNNRSAQQKSRLYEAFEILKETWLMILIP